MLLTCVCTCTINLSNEIIVGKVPHDYYILSYTAGKCYTGTNAKSLSQCMESVSQKLHQGVVLNFRKIGSEEERSLSSARETPGKTPEHSTDIVNGNGGEEPREVSPSTRANAWHNTRKMIYVKPNPKTNVPVGHWPIPESFWPDSSLSTLVSELLFILNSAI